MGARRLLPVLLALGLACRVGGPDDDTPDDEGEPGTPGDTGDSVPREDTATNDTGCTARVWYIDWDADGYGTDARTQVSCEAPAPIAGASWAAEPGDCAPRDPAIHPGAAEACDGVDSDCAQGGDAIDEQDGDGDHVRACEDCDDGDDGIRPGRSERCDGRDEDCDGLVDEEARDAPEWYPDADGDGHGVPAGALASCEAPEGMASLDDDCDDTDARRAPGLEDVAGDALDNDCDGAVDEAATDFGPYGCDHTVPGTESTIQAAIDAAGAGAVICVAPGTWSENLDFGGHEVTVWGVLGAAATVLDGGGADSVVRFQSGEGPGATLRGFTVTGGAPSWGEGGGIQVRGSSPTLEDLDVRDNRSASYGGGIYVESGDPSLTNVRIRDNALTYHYCGADYGWGGGIYLASSAAVLDNVVVEGNRAGEGGGGLAAWSSDLVLSHVVVRDNTAGWAGGGGVYAYGGTLALEAAIVVDNVAADAAWGPSDGGGLLLRGTAASLTQGVVAGNATDGDGGGVLLRDGATLALTHAVVVQNAASGDGGGACVEDGAWSPSWSDLWANLPEDVSGVPDPTGSDGNLSCEPGFTAGAWTLDAGSPLADAGDPTRADPDGTCADLGAYGGPAASGWDLDGDGYPAAWAPGATSPADDCDDEDAGVYPGAGC